VFSRSWAISTRLDSDVLAIPFAAVFYAPSCWTRVYGRLLRAGRQFRHTDTCSSFGASLDPSLSLPFRMLGCAPSWFQEVFCLGLSSPPPLEVELPLYLFDISVGDDGVYFLSPLSILLGYSGFPLALLHFGTSSCELFTECA